MRALTNQIADIFSPNDNNPILNVFEFNWAKYKFGDVSTKRACELCKESRRIYICRIERNKRLV